MGKTMSVMTWHVNDDNQWTGGGGGIGGIDPADTDRAVDEFVRSLKRNAHNGRAHAIVEHEDYWDSPVENRRRCLPVARHHDDADFCEVARSMVSHYENVRHRPNLPV